MNNNHSQLKSILASLQSGDTLTPMDALRRFNCMRLGARIKDLKDGKLNHTRYDIQTIMVSEGGKRFAKYVLMNPRLRMIDSIPAFPPKPVEQTNNQLLF